MKIGVMGARGSFSEQAGELYIKKVNQPEAEILPLVSAENVLMALNKGEIDRAIFPIENSNGGIVIEAVYAMAQFNFEIETMFELDVHHMLLVRPGVTASHINTIASHPNVRSDEISYTSPVIRSNGDFLSPVVNGMRFLSHEALVMARCKYLAVNFACPIIESAMS